MKIAETARPEPKSASAIPASPQQSSSDARAKSSPDLSANALTMKSRLYRPTLDASSMIGQGVSSRSSHSRAAGRITRSAKSWTQRTTSSWSSLNWSENAVDAATELPSRAHATPRARTTASPGNYQMVTKASGMPRRRPLPDRAHVLRHQAFWALLDVELHRLPLFEHTVATHLDGAVMHEDIGPAVRLRDEAVALLGVEPLDCSGCHCGNPPCC